MSGPEFWLAFAWRLGLCAVGLAVLAGVAWKVLAPFPPLW